MASNKQKYVLSNPKKAIEKQESGLYVPTSYRIPDGVSVFRFREAKTYKLDIIPFIVKKGNPRADEGEVHYERTFWVHRDVGINEETHICLLRTYNKPCPICEYAAKLRKEGAPPEALEPYKAKQRQLWYVYDRDEKDKGYQLFETGYYRTFGELLNDKLDAADDDSPFLYFHSPENGMTLYIKTKEDSYNGKKYFKPSNIEFMPRKGNHPFTDLSEIESLDDLLKPLSYEKLKEIFIGGMFNSDETHTDDTEDDEDDDMPKSVKSTVDDDDDDTDDDDENDDEDDAPKSKGKKSKPIVKNEDDAPKSKGKKSKPIVDDDEDEDEEDENPSTEYEVGKKVTFVYKKATKVGEIVKINKAKKLVEVQCDDRDKPYVLDFDDPSLKVLTAKDLKMLKKDEDDEDEEEDDLPKNKGKKPKQPVDEDEEDDDDDDDDDGDDELRNSPQESSWLDDDDDDDE